MRLFAALGPGDIVNAARLGLAGQIVPETSLAFSEQLLRRCEELGFPTLAVSSNARRDQLREGLISIENCEKPHWGSRGILYHVATIYYGLYLAFRARLFGADLAIIDSGTTNYFVFAAFRMLGVRVAVNLHNVLWPCGFRPQSGTQKIIAALNGWFFRNVASGAIGVSPECERQVLDEARNRIPFFQYRCQFSEIGFQRSTPYTSGPFQIACASRVEQNKGVLDILRISSRLKILLQTPIIFHICGDGSAVEEMKMQIEHHRLQDTIIMHGRLERSALLSIYANSHAVIVPTRSTFSEGMPQVCAEAMFCGLPVITSKVTNAFDVIGSATIQADTDNVESYVDAILNLIKDRDLYERLRSECAALSKQFLDRSQSYPAAVERLVSYLCRSSPSRNRSSPS